MRIRRAPVSRTLLVALVACGSGCASRDYVHAVYFKLKANVPTERVDAFINDSTRELARIPGVRSVHCGRRDAGMTRAVSDTDFDVGLIIRFADRSAYRRYGDHPIHKAQIEKHKDIIAKMRVFDFTICNGPRVP